MTSSLQFQKITSENEFPSWASRDRLVHFFHEVMQPYHDQIPDIEKALDYALVSGRGQGGFLMLAQEKDNLVGALCMLQTGMGGYIPENVLLFVAVNPDLRGQGIGGKLIEHSLRECKGAVKLHVEYDNPAKRLYERLGFQSKYAEMRWVPEGDQA